MPRLVRSFPAYQLHRASGQAVVTLNGRDCYLGPHNSNASRVEYDRLIAEWLANGRRRVGRDRGAPSPTILELVSAYW